MADLVGKIDVDRRHGNLSSAIRLFVLGSVRDQAERPGEANSAAA